MTAVNFGRSTPVGTARAENIEVGVSKEGVGFGTAGVAGRPFALADVSRLELGAILRLTGPIAAVMLLNMGMSLTDVVMVGWYGSAALAAVAVMSDAYSIIFYLTAGVLAAVAPMIAQARGSGRTAEVRRTVRHGLWAAILIAAPAAAGVWVAPDAMRLIGLDPGIIAAGTPYARLMAGTIAVMMPLVLWRHVLSAFERPKIFMWFTAGALPLNAVGNYALMFGAWGFPEMGLAGAAASSFIVAAAMSLGLTVYVLAAPSLRRYRFLRRVWVVKPARIREIFWIGIPIGVSSFAETGVFLTATILIALFPPEAVAAHTIVLRTAGVLYGPLAALGQAVTVRTAHALGAGDHARLRRGLTTALFAGGLAGGVYLLAISSSAQTVPWLFLSTADPNAPEVASIAAGLLILLALCDLAHAPASAVLGALRGYKDTRVPMLLSLAGQWGIGFISGLILAFGLGWEATGIWAGLVIGTVCTGSVSYLRLLRVIRAHEGAAVRSTL